jgi:uncharacterized protein
VAVISRFRRLVLVAPLLAFIFFVDARPAAAQFPAPTGRVNDFANLLRQEDREALEAQLTELERATSAEVAVVTVRTLDGRSVEEYATALFAEWGIGKRQTDNGVLILVAVDDREMRVEVGYGLEGVLPDGLAGSVIRNTFLPRFRDNDYRAGIIEGTARIVDIVRRNETLTAEQRAAIDRAAADENRVWLVAALVAPILAATAFMAGAALSAKSGGMLVMSSFFILFFGLIAGGNAPRWTFWPLAILIVALLVVGIVLGRKPAWRRRLRGTGKGAGGSGWVSGSSGTSGSSRSGSGSSSFGGGRSGGGGASGRW